MSAFAQLLAQPGVVERVTLRGPVGFMAYHGGNLEAMTDVIAERASAEAGASCYSVIQPPGMSEHLPSIEVRRSSTGSRISSSATLACGSRIELDTSDVAFIRDWYERRDDAGSGGGFPDRHAHEGRDG